MRWGSGLAIALWGQARILQSPVRVTEVVMVPKMETSAEFKNVQKMQKVHFSWYWRFPSFRRWQASKTYAYAYDLLVFHPRTVRNRQNREHRGFSNFLTKFDLGVISLRRKYWLVQERPENEQKTLFLDFDDFRDLEADKQAKHMHMHVICLPKILGISEIVKIEKVEYFQISSLNFT